MRKLKEQIIRTVSSAGEGHLPSAFSILDILWVLYDRVLHVDPKNPRAPDRDLFFLSKGHASVGYYAVLAEKGFFDSDALNTYANYNSFLGGHPDRNKVPGVEASTGSLGHGFPMAVGAAFALKIQHKQSRVFALIGDGEANEGTIWEASLLASHHQLDNLCVIVDHNHSTDRAVIIDDLQAKFSAFGWQTVCVNGHDHKALEQNLNSIHKGKPLAIIAQTIKGYGCKTIENNPGWHHRMPTTEEAETLIQELV